MQALLHGHSYTAYPIGCAATVAAIQLLTRREHNPNICTPDGGSPTCPTPRECTKKGTACARLISLWDPQHLQRLSSHSNVAHVMCIGTILAVQLKPQRTQQEAQSMHHNSASGPQVNYAATTCSSLEVVSRLRLQHHIYARPLGDVVYLMVPPTARKETCTWLAAALLSVLDSGMQSHPEATGQHNNMEQPCASGDGVVV